MKKFLSIICIFTMLTSLISCGDSGSISDTPEVSESSITETATEVTYELETENEVNHTTNVKNSKVFIEDVSKRFSDSSNNMKSLIKEETEKAETNKNNSVRRVKGYLGNIFFKLPEGYEKEVNSSDESMEAITYKYANGQMINMARQSGASEFDLYNQDDSVKRMTLEALVSSALENYFDKVGDLEDTTIGGEYAVKQQAVYSGTDIPMTVYSFVFKDNIYTFMFTDMEDSQNDIVNSITFDRVYIDKSTENSTKATTEKNTEPITEPPTTKAPETQPPVIETTPVQTTLHFILNLDTNCIHIDSGCSAAQKIAPENYSTVDIAESDLGNYNGIYWACGKCCSNDMRQKLPKF